MPKRKPCQKCGRPAARSRCAACSAARREWYAARKAAGLCPQTGCHKRAQPGHAYCRAHGAYKRAKLRAYKAARKATT